MNKNPDDNVAIESPCVRNCCLDQNDICLGCFRHLNEIIAWSSASVQDKQAILQRCAQRRAVKNP